MHGGCDQGHASPKHKVSVLRFGISLDWGVYTTLTGSVNYVLPAGYWAFGWSVAPFLVSSFTFPTGLIAAVYVLAIIQIVGCYQIYARPTFGATHAWFSWLALSVTTNEMQGYSDDYRLEAAMSSNHFHNICSSTNDLILLFASAVLPQCSPSLRAGFFYMYALNQNGTVWCARNVITRAIITTIYMAIITLIACLVPFFGRVPKSPAPWATLLHSRVGGACSYLHMVVPFRS